jgi:hypothetical protein
MTQQSEVKIEHLEQAEQELTPEQAEEAQGGMQASWSQPQPVRAFPNDNLIEGRTT